MTSQDLITLDCGATTITLNSTGENAIKQAYYCGQNSGQYAQANTTTKTSAASHYAVANTYTLRKLMYLLLIVALLPVTYAADLKIVEMPETKSISPIWPTPMLLVRALTSLR
ncbi:hypothetical protein OGAPHI_006571 [Ogataea philodendri]|uniref:Uncharacterized protein n=1 Tax=Ogataea philodendri TaxID=1378263 RepID=A0A9P8NXC5_9ASCO|nr:uncharacterized protein OGAPHI_006571 [Ogataea philodendri]KAH3661164.1 hypothetical protein OGAPHI_006571 [Ogataea philodendri]